MTVVYNKLLVTQNFVYHAFTCNDYHARVKLTRDVHTKFACVKALSGAVSREVLCHEAVDIPYVHVCVRGPHDKLGDVAGYLKQHKPIWALVCRDEETPNPLATQAFQDVGYGTLGVCISPHELGIPHRQVHTWYVLVNDAHYLCNDFPDQGAMEERWRACAMQIDAFKKFCGARVVSLSL